MRAKYVNESLSFKRGGDPLKSMGLGISPFHREAFVEYLANSIPKILGTESIPKDILGANIHFIIKREYIKPIQIFMDDILEKLNINFRFIDRVRDQKAMEDVFGYNIWRDLEDYFQKRGFLKESLSFNRGGNPLRSMGLGIDPLDRKIFIPFLIRMIPEILGVPEIPKDILGESGYMIKRIYFIKIQKYIMDWFNNINFPYIKGPAGNISTDDTFHYNLWMVLMETLLEMGYIKK
jgi:hypothetical protein